MRSGTWRKWALPAVLIIVGTIAPKQSICAELQTNWQRLSSGRFSTGFRSSYAIDYSHPYNPGPRDAMGRAPVKTPRPVLLNIWYPAKPGPPAAGSALPQPMTHRDYLQFPPLPRPEVKLYAERLQLHTLRVIAKEVFRDEREIESLLPDERKLLDQYFDRPTGTLRDAPPAEGRFPLLLYRHGIIGAFEENAPLFELLASHGYVLVSAAYDPADTYEISTVNPAARCREEMEFVLGQMYADPHVDWQHIAAMGHSMGAQTSIGMAMQNPLIDAVVSLDTTFDCFPVPVTLKIHKIWADLLTEPRRLIVPLLAAARQCANFDLVRSFRYSARTLLRTRDMVHDDFIWHGIAGAILLQRPNAQALRDQYEALLLYSYHFLNRYLKEAPASGQFLSRAAAHQPVLKGVGFDVEQLPALPPPPTAGDIVRHIAAEGKARTVAWLKEIVRRDPEGVPVGIMARYVLQLELRAHPEAAAVLARIVVELYPGSHVAHAALGQLLRWRHANQEAIAAYEAALRCFPEQLSEEEAKAKEDITATLNRLREGLKK